MRKIILFLLVVLMAVAFARGQDSPTQWPTVEWASVVVHGAPAPGRAVITDRARLVVLDGRSELGRVTVAGRAIVQPSVANVCSVPRFRRNLLAASSGSQKAARYLLRCAVAHREAK
jgi:hypothetical protein